MYYTLPEYIISIQIYGKPSVSSRYQIFYCITVIATPSYPWSVLKLNILQFKRYISQLFAQVNAYAETAKIPSLGRNKRAISLFRAFRSIRESDIYVPIYARNAVLTVSPNGFLGTWVLENLTSLNIYHPVKLKKKWFWNKKRKFDQNFCNSQMQF